MKISKEKLIEKLKVLDQRLLQIWIDDQLDLHDDERWEIFVVLLETRVELLTTCRDAGVALGPEVCMPPWLDKLTSSRRETRLRDLKLLYDEIRQKKNIKAYEEVAQMSQRDQEIDL